MSLIGLSLTLIDTTEGNLPLRASSPPNCSTKLSPSRVYNLFELRLSTLIYGLFSRKQKTVSPESYLTGLNRLLRFEASKLTMVWVEVVLAPVDATKLYLSRVYLPNI
jgi:hypothetical protein